jgi:hypothetical protein
VLALRAAGFFSLGPWCILISGMPFSYVVYLLLFSLSGLHVTVYSDIVTWQFVVFAAHDLFYLYPFDAAKRLTIALSFTSLGFYVVVVQMKK